MLFFIPMLYSFKTRYKGKVGISAWGVKYLLPVFFISFGLHGFSLIRFVLGLLFLYGLYEIGFWNLLYGGVCFMFPEHRF